MRTLTGGLVQPRQLPNSSSETVTRTVRSVSVIIFIPDYLCEVTGSVYGDGKKIFDGKEEHNRFQTGVKHGGKHAVYVECKMKNENVNLHPQISGFILKISSTGSAHSLHSPPHFVSVPKTHLFCVLRLKTGSLRAHAYTFMLVFHFIHWAPHI